MYYINNMFLNYFFYNIIHIDVPQSSRQKCRFVNYYTIHEGIETSSCWNPSVAGSVAQPSHWAWQWWEHLSWISGARGS